MSDPIEPIDPELEALLQAERARPEEDAGSPRAHRVLAAVMISVGAAAAGGAATAAAGAGAGGGGGAAGGASPWLVGALSMAIGIVVGAGSHAAWTASRETSETAVVEAGVGAETGTVTEPATAPVEPARVTEAVAVAESDAGAMAEAATEIGTGSERAGEARAIGTGATRVADAGIGVLARESALIARAQSALARGAPELAIAALREHESRHPRGQLAEEREALWVSALVGAGDVDGARARAARFRARHPGSPLLPAVEAALEAAP